MTVAAVLVGVAVMTFGSTASAQTPVTVENPETDPVPVSGTVTVDNLPAVQDVQVTNFPPAPAAKQRVQIYDVTLITPGDSGFAVFGFGKPIYSVPRGKRLIVETVSGSVSDLEGVNYDLSLRGSAGAELGFLLTTKGVFNAATIPEKGRDAVTVAATLIVEPGDELTYQFIRDVATSPEQAGTSVTVVGFLEDVP